MKTIIRALGMFGAIAIIYATGYFIKLYTDFTQLLFSLGVAGLLILAALVYIYNWMKTKDENLKGMNKAIDLTRDYIREVEKKIK